MQLFFASRDGHTRRIAQRIASSLEDSKLTVQVRDLAERNPAPEELEGPVVLVAAVRYGKHLPQARQFLAMYGKLTAPPPLVFLSVNLTARKADKRTPEESPYLRKAIQLYGVKPVLAHAIAGRLDYPRYSTFDRQMIRFIMLLTGGPTDPSTTIEYTDWAEVEDLAKRITLLATP